MHRFRHYRNKNAAKNETLAFGIFSRCLVKARNTLGIEAYHSIIPFV
jgi:hypothetical protein